MKQSALIKKVEHIRKELNHYIFLMINMKDITPEIRLRSRNFYGSLYSKCQNECNEYEIDINKFYNILICNISIGLYDIDFQLRWEYLANGFNCIKNSLRQIIIEC